MEPLFLVAAEPATGGLVGALGLDLRSLILNSLAFFVILAILSRYVYPVLLKALDAKRDQLLAAAKSDALAKEALVQAEANARTVLHEARRSADDVLSNAKSESDEMLVQARSKADEQAARITREAREQLGIDVEAARLALKVETARLVTLATETILDEKLDDKRDAEMVGRSLKGAKS